MTLEDIKKVRQKRNVKINNCIGVIQGFQWLRKNKWLGIKQKITQHQYRRIIRECNNALIDLLFESGNVNIPYGLGKLQIRKQECRISYENGKLDTNLRIDWGRTMRLWSQDDEAREKKILLRHEQKYNYYILYTKKETANFKNRIYYKLRITRSVQKRMRDKIDNNELDAFLI